MPSCKDQCKTSLHRRLKSWVHDIILQHTTIFSCIRSLDFIQGREELNGLNGYLLILCCNTWPIFCQSFSMCHYSKHWCNSIFNLFKCYLLFYCIIYSPCTVSKSMKPVSIRIKTNHCVVCVTQVCLMVQQHPLM